MNAKLVFAAEYPLPKIVKLTHSLNRVIELTFGDETFTVHFKLPGKHQIENLRLAVAAIDNLPAEFEIRPPDLEAGIEYVRDNVFFKARMQFIGKTPPVIIDGAHNVESIKALVQTLDDSKYKGMKFNILFAAMKDKDIAAMLKELKPLAGKFIFTVPANERAAGSDSFEKIATALDIEYTFLEDVIDAYIYANKLQEPLLITGSFYLAGEVLKYLKY